MTDYKSTINLPQTAFPMKADLARREPGRVAAWDERGIYGKQRQVAHGRPRFVLHEIQLIADSTDPIKRSRGRRGLDVLTKLQELAPIDISETDYTDVTGVDAKLVRMARDVGAKLVTNDYNLNRVAHVEGVAVLNINELANAVKPIVLPGEEMHVAILREGKEPQQGVGYLDDGTMIVVENGRRLIGESTDVVVTSVLQTVAGRMIFAKAKR